MIRRAQQFNINSMKITKPAVPPKFDDILAFLGEAKINGDTPETVGLALGLDNPEISSDCLTFVRSKDAIKVGKTVLESKARVYLIPDKTPDFDIPEGKCVLRVRDPNSSFIKIQKKYFIDPETNYYPQGIHLTALVDKSARVSDSAQIGAYVVIGPNCIIESRAIIHSHVVLYHNVQISEDCIIHAHAVIREHSVIGKNCIVQAGAVIGSEGFGYTLDPKLGLELVPQLGHVKIGDRVEIGANTCIDRATSGQTSVGSGTKIDNLVQLGHNVEIGSNAVLCGQAGIGGSTKVADGVVLGGKVGVADHVNIGSSIRVGGGASVTHDLKEPGDYMGNPACPAFSWRKITLAQKRLPELLKAFKKLIPEFPRSSDGD